MKKILCMVLALLICIAMLAGCGDTTPESGSEDPGQSGSDKSTPSGEGVKITDSYTFTDPTDIEFDTRYVLYMGPESSMVSSMVEKGELCQYSIIYAKDEVAVAEYDLYVCDSVESAQGIQNEAESYGMVADLIEEDNTVICMFSDQYVLEANIAIYQMAEMVSDTTASAYVDFYVSYYGASIVE